MISTAFKVEQGTLDDGYIPQNRFDMLIAAADHATWQAIKAFPTGTTAGEWKEWVDRMARVVMKAVAQAESLAQNNECATFSFMPFIMWSFMRLHDDYMKTSTPFDLQRITLCDPSVVPEGVRPDKVRICEEDEYFIMDVSWMEEYVRKWNMVRQERGLPILDLVRTPIAEGSASPREGTDSSTQSSPSILLPSKPNTNEVAQTGQKRGRNKRKDVDRSQSVIHDHDRGRSSTPCHSRPAPPRRSSRNRTQPVAHVPKVVSRSSAKRSKTSKTVTINEPSSTPIYPPSSSLPTEPATLPEPCPGPESVESQDPRGFVPEPTAELEMLKADMTALRNEMHDVRRAKEMVEQELIITKQELVCLNQTVANSISEGLANISRTLASLLESHAKEVHSATYAAASTSIDRMWPNLIQTFLNPATSSNSFTPPPTIGLSPHRFIRHPDPVTSQEPISADNKRMLQMMVDDPLGTSTSSSGFSPIPSVASPRPGHSITLSGDGFIDGQSSRGDEGETG